MEARRLPRLRDRRLEMSHNLSCTIPSTAGRTGQLDRPQGDVAVGAGGGGPCAAGTSRAWRAVEAGEPGGPWRLVFHLPPPAFNLV